jgi:germination protein M
MRSRTLLLAAAVVLALPACGDDDGSGSATTVTSTAPSTAASTTPPTTATPTTAAPTTAAPTTAPTTAAPTSAPIRTTDVRVYLLRGELVAIVHRQVPAETPLRGALEALVAGPTAAEAALGFLTAIPAGTEVLGVNLSDGLATVDLSGEFDDGGGSLSMQARLAEVVFTATQFPEVTGVDFRLDGTPVTVFGSEGIELTEPQSRLGYHGFTSGVLVDAPLPGGQVRSPVVITGESDVYEANFMVDVYAGGQLVSSQGYQAGGAWGNWEDFEISVPVMAAPGPIEIDLYDEGGCGTDPECPPIVHNVVPLELVG